MARHAAAAISNSHNTPLMPVAMSTAVTGMYCLPIFSCLGFSFDREGRFSEGSVDFFGSPAWDEVRLPLLRRGR